MNAAAYRERMIAAAQAIEDFYTLHRDAEGNLPAEHDEQLAALNAQFRTDEAAYRTAAAAEGTVTSAREVLSVVHQAVKGTPLNWSQVAVAPRRARASLGAQFVESPAYRDLVKSGALASDHTRFGHSGRFQSAGASDIIHTEPTGVGEGVGPAGALVAPTYINDVIPLGQRPLRIRDLFTQDTAPDAPIIDARQVARYPAAGPVAQATSTGGSGHTGGVKPQSSIGWEAFETYPRTIATWMATTRQALRQDNRVRVLIDSEGQYMVSLAEEDQLINGTGLNDEVLGLLALHDIQTLRASSMPGIHPNVDAIRKAKTMTLIGLARVPADAVAIHPNDSMQLDLIKDLYGRYLAGDPFGTGMDPQPPIWRLPRVESEAIEEGTCIVAAWKLGGTVYDVMPVVIYMSDSHEDFFVRNLIAILFEERVALVVRRPTAFVKITFADWDAVGS